METHTRKIGFFRRVRKHGRHRGSMLVEATLAMAMLSTIGLILLKLSLNVTTPRQWTLQQAITDSYLTIEKATAQRQSFENIIGPTSLWPLDPVTTTVEFGKLPGGTPITGTITRRRTPGPDNGNAANNPTGMRVWHLQSVAKYTVGSRSYIKSRTVVRSQ